MYPDSADDKTLRLTDCANTRIKNICTTFPGFGKTCSTILTSSPTVVRIAEYSVERPGSILGEGVSGSGNGIHLVYLSVFISVE